MSVINSQLMSGSPIDLKLPESPKNGFSQQLAKLIGRIFSSSSYQCPAASDESSIEVLSNRIHKLESKKEPLDRDLRKMKESYVKRAVTGGIVKNILSRLFGQSPQTCEKRSSEEKTRERAGEAFDRKVEQNPKRKEQVRINQEIKRLQAQIQEITEDQDPRSSTDIREEYETRKNTIDGLRTELSSKRKLMDEELRTLKESYQQRFGSCEGERYFAEESMSSSRDLKSGITHLETRINNKLRELTDLEMRLVKALRRERKASKEPQSSKIGELQQEKKELRKMINIRKRQHVIEMLAEHGHNIDSQTLLAEQLRAKAKQSFKEQRSSLTSFCGKEQARIHEIDKEINELVNRLPESEEIRTLLEEVLEEKNRYECQLNDAKKAALEEIGKDKEKYENALFKTGSHVANRAEKIGKLELKINELVSLEDKLKKTLNIYELEESKDKTLREIKALCISLQTKEQSLQRRERDLETSSRTNLHSSVENYPLHLQRLRLKIDEYGSLLKENEARLRTNQERAIDSMADLTLEGSLTRRSYGETEELKGLIERLDQKINQMKNQELPLIELRYEIEELNREIKEQIQKFEDFDQRLQSATRSA